MEEYGIKSMTTQSVKIADILKSKKVTLSFEVFPPKKKEGLEEGRAEGIAEGIAEGKIEGASEEKRETVFRMRHAGISDDIIMTATGLSEEELRSFEKAGFCKE